MTILRRSEHRALENIELDGTVVDLGGEPRSAYRKLIGGIHTVTTVNLSEELGADIVANLEKKLPIPDNSYDHAILMNVLEHIFEYRQLLSETARIIKSKGKVLIVVPFLFPYHASPDDYHRYTQATLRRVLGEAGFENVDIIPLGSGVIAARYALVERLLPSKVQDMLSVTHPIIRTIDKALAKFAAKTGRAYRRSDYALGFRVIASKI